MTHDYALVTGGALNIGKAICERLTEDGLQVITLDITEPEHDSYVHFEPVDLSNAENTQACLKNLTNKFAITRLVNNVGIVAPAPLEDVSIDDFEKVMNTNARSALICTQAVLPAMKQHKFGRIVSTASRVIQGKELRSNYGASKGAIVAMSKTWALELAEYGITVNCVAPGPIATSAFWRNNPVGSDRANSIVNGIPLGRMGTPEDIAHSVSYYLDSRSSFVTGQVEYVCGGLTIGSPGF